jgi:hypothetical protein
MDSGTGTEAFSPTPRSAINFLESCEPDNPAIHRELIVVDLFTMKAALPQYTSRIKIDKVIKLIERVDAELPATSPLRSDEDYKPC